MGPHGVQVWRGLLFACFLLVCVSQETPGPVYLVTVPAIIQAGSEAKLCVSLLQPNETLVMTVTLMDNHQNRTLLHESFDQEVHRCFHFQAPVVAADESIQKIKVEVHGETFHSTEERNVMFKPFHPTTTIQTDKPIYLPGHIVHFRIITLDNNFIPVNQLYDFVELEDFNRNMIGQWINVTSNGKIVQLSHQLNSEAPQGTYQFIVTTGLTKTYQSFKVKQYVLPKFEVKLKSSDEISVNQHEVKVEVCATYTYGQPVPGMAEMELCRLLESYYVPSTESAGSSGDAHPICEKESLQLNKVGCASHFFSMFNYMKNDPKPLQSKLHFEAKVEEDGTGTFYTDEKEIQLSYMIGKLTFVETPKHFELGSVIEGKIKVVHFNNTPIPHKPVHLFEGERWAARLLLNLTTDDEGIAHFSLNTTGRAEQDINLLASDSPSLQYAGYKTQYHETGQQTISYLRPTSAFDATTSSLNVEEKHDPLECGKETQITIKYIIAGEVVKTGSIDIMYMALSRGAIVHYGHENIKVNEDPVTQGEISIKLTVAPEMAPMVQVLAYSVLPSENIIAHKRNFPTEKCFKHQVSVQFSPPKAVPGEENTLQVSALPGSLCGLSAVDQSVLLLESGKRLDADKIFNLLPVTEATDFPYRLEDPLECLHVRPRRYVIPNPGSRDGKQDAYKVFKSLGLKIATNLVIRNPSCLMYKGMSYYHSPYDRMAHPVQYMLMSGPAGSVGASGSRGAGGGAPPVETIRTFFPETWIWNLMEVGDSGTAQVPLTVPDTITTWETEAFCLAPAGFGLAPPVQITVFQPFFLELTLPYSIIRGEQFELKATVFNYLPKCIMVEVTPAPSSDYTLTPVSDGLYSSCLCANERKTFLWTLNPSVLGKMNVSVNAEAVQSQTVCDNEIVSVPERGRVDKVTRTLLVKAEGIEHTNSVSWLLCPTGEALNEEVELHFPVDVVKGSERASISVLGDILGRALQNIEGLLQMPYGCGEQNMALLAPNIYILHYLKNTGQLTPAIREKATDFLKNGYQRQLNYRHSNGAFSTFGQGDGNTWLTAFVMRSFGKAKTFIFIDPIVIEQAKDWLERRQKDDGCIRSLGKLFNNRMKGGVNNDVTLTAYITASLLELNMSVSDPIVNKSLSCLRSSSSNLTNTYATALLAYTFSLAGEGDISTKLLLHLNEIASKEGGLLHWSQSSSERSDSLNVEISSYVLLAVLSKKPLTNEDLGYASRIVRWLAKQQNSYGGFSSTQDTVVALQALSLYSTLVFSPEGSSTVTVQSPGGNAHSFEVNPNNKLLYQERELKEPVGKFSVEVKGSACASVQLSYHYNLPAEKSEKTLSVHAHLDGICNSKALLQSLRLNFTVKYDGTQDGTNMVIVDVKMLSGFAPHTKSLDKLKGNALVDRVEAKDDHVLIYLTRIPKSFPLNYQLDIVQQIAVKDIKPAAIKVYDYYETSDQVETEYTFPCNEGVA